MSESENGKYKQFNQKEHYQTHLGDNLELFMRFTEVNEFSVDTQKAWENFTSRIDRAKNTRSLKWVWSIAASVILLITTTLAIYQSGWDSEPDFAVTVVSSGATQKSLSLPDGTLVTLAPESMLKFTAENFGEDVRKVSFQGEGFFEVRKGDTPFSIKTEKAAIDVLGTTFSVNTQKGVQVYVVEGLVALKTDKQSGEIGPGKLAFTDQDGRIKVKNASQNVVSWKTGVFQFDDTRVSEAFSHLSKYYQLDFTSSQGLQNCKITVSFKEEPLEHVVEVLSTILTAKSEITQNQVLFSGKGCN